MTKLYQYKPKATETLATTFYHTDDNGERHFVTVHANNLVCVTFPINKDRNAYECLLSPNLEQFWISEDDLNNDLQPLTKEQTRTLKE